MKHLLSFVIMGFLGAACLAAEGLPNPDGAASEQGQEEACPTEHAKLYTEDATPVAPGDWELQFGYSFTQARRAWDDHWATRRRSLAQEHLMEMTVKRGLVENLDLGLTLGYADIVDRECGEDYCRGLTDMTIAAKWRFYHDEERRLSFAYVPGITIPTGRLCVRGSRRDRPAPTKDYWSFDQRLAMTKDCGRWTLNADMGYLLPLGGRRKDARGTLEANVALGYQLLDWLQPEVELNYAHDFLKGTADADVLAVTAGVIVQLSEHWRLMTGIQQAVAGRNAEKFTAGVVSLTLCY